MFTFETKTNLKNKKILIVDDNSFSNRDNNEKYIDSLMNNNNCLVVGLTLFEIHVNHRILS